MVPAKGFGLFEDIEGAGKVIDELFDETRIDLGIEGVNGYLLEIGEDLSVWRFGVFCS